MDDDGIAGRDFAQAFDGEFADERVLLRQRLLALKRVHFHGVLVVVESEEDLRLAGGKRSVARNDGGANHSFKAVELRQGARAEGVRGDIDEDGVVLFAGEDRALDGRAHGHDQVRVYLPARLQLHALLEQPVHERRAR